MIKCQVCEQGTHGHWTGLCYHHQKYADGTAGPYFETLYDLLYWKATFLPSWDSRHYGTINVTCAEHVDAQKMNGDLVTKTRRKVADAICSGTTDLTDYLPLVRKLALKYGSDDYDEVYSILAAELISLERKIPKGTQPMVISIWVKRRLTGAALNWVCRRQPDLEDTEIDEIPHEAPTSEEIIMLCEDEDIKGKAMIELANQLSKRQSKVMANMLSPNPLTQKQLAKRLKVDQAQVSRDTKIIFTKAKELRHGYT